MPVDLIVAGTTIACRSIETSDHRLPRRLLQPAAQFIHYPLHDGARGIPSSAGQNIFQREKLRDEMNVRLNGLKEFGLKQHLLEVQPVQSIFLHHLDHGCRKVLAYVPKPSSYIRARRAEAAPAVREIGRASCRERV